MHRILKINSNYIFKSIFFRATFLTFIHIKYMDLYQHELQTSGFPVIQFTLQMSSSCERDLNSEVQQVCFDFQ